MRAWASLVVIVSTSGCLFYNPAYGDETGASTSGASQSSTEPSTASTASTSTAATATDTGGSGSASDSAATTSTTGAVDSTGPATTGTSASTGSTGCAEELLYPDGDSDGYGVEPAVMVCAGTPGYAAQAGDCDDASGGINPGAVEVCDPMKVDEDCDGLKNEASPMNASCDDCNLAEYGGHSYWFCGAMVSWDAARGLCQTFGPVDLVIVDDASENQWIFPQTPASTTWLGGRDMNPQVALDYTWWNGAPLAFNAFAKTDLDNGCIAMPDADNSKWRDRDCGFAYGFVCESL